jgi:hypothetical protein
MVKVLCTVVFILGSGYRQVEQLDGIVLKNNGGPKIFVDFGSGTPEPQARWVPENDCQYYEDPSKVYGDPEVFNKFVNEYRNGLRRMLERPIK